MPKRPTIRFGPGVSARFKPGRNGKGGSYQMRYYDKDRTPPQIERSLRTDDPGVAGHRGGELYRRMQLGDFDPWDEQGADLGVLEALGLYERLRKRELADRTLRDARYMVERFVACTKQRDPGIRRLTLGSVHPHHVTLFVFRPGLNEQSALNCYRRLRAFFRWCVKEGLMKASPTDEVARPKVPKLIPRHLTRPELDRVLRAAEIEHERTKGLTRPRQRPLWTVDAIDLIASLGLRPAEAPRITWGDVVWPSGTPGTDGFRPGYVIVRSREGARTKTKDDDTVPMNPRAERRLRTLQGETRRSDDENEPVLKAADGASRISPDYLNKRFVHFRKVANVNRPTTLYSLRHTYAFLLTDAGLSLQEIKELMRHRDIASTMVYAVMKRDVLHQRAHAAWSEREDAIEESKPADRTGSMSARRARRRKARKESL